MIKMLFCHISNKRTNTHLYFISSLNINDEKQSSTRPPHTKKARGLNIATIYIVNFYLKHTQYNKVMQRPGGK